MWTKMDCLKLTENLIKFKCCRARRNSKFPLNLWTLPDFYKTRINRHSPFYFIDIFSLVIWLKKTPASIVNINLNFTLAQKPWNGSQEVRSRAKVCFCIFFHLEYVIDSCCFKKMFFLLNFYMKIVALGNLVFVPKIRWMVWWSQVKNAMANR